MSHSPEKSFYERRVFDKDLLVYFEWNKPISPSQWIVAWHGAEICFVYKGFVEHCFPDRKIRINEGEVGLLNYLQPHRTIASSQGAFVSYNFHPGDKGFSQNQHTSIFKVPKVSLYETLSIDTDGSFLGNLISWICQRPTILTQARIEEILNSLVQNLARSGTVNQSDQRISSSQLIQMRRYLEEHYDQKISLGDLATLSHLSRFHLLRMFKSHFGCTPIEYQQFIRLNKALQMLISKPMPIDHVGSEVGFQDLSFFIKKFRRAYGKPPGLLNRIVNRA